jgi:putative toxin-antitoxin system antitoxin component (TIGR02293 family)
MVCAILYEIRGKWHKEPKMATKQNKRRDGLAESASPAYVAPETPAYAPVDDLAQAAEANLPFARAKPEALASLSQHGYSDEEIWRLVVPRRTLARRQAANEPLTIEETDKALRLERIALNAERVFGDSAKAYRWLRKPKRALNDATPVDFLASEVGARIVDDMLLRIEHGIFA